MKFFIILFLLLETFLFPESFHNINGFLGERDSGMGGAFTAISDDASGMYYNPAGLSFSIYDTISTSSLNFTHTEKTFVDVTGPSQYLGSSQNYVRQSKGFTPSFIGVITSIKKLKFGFSVINSKADNFDQFNSISNPVYLKGLADVKVKYSEANSRLLYGPSVSGFITDKISWGISLLGFLDTSKVNSAVSTTLSNGSFTTDNTYYNRTSYGVMPIIGFQYMPLDKLSFGISFRRPFNTHGSERSITQSISGTSLSASTINFEDSSNNAYGQYLGYSTSYPITPSSLAGTPQMNAKTPEPREVRMGTAFYASRDLIFSLDVIYNSGYSLEKELNKVDPFNQVIVYSGYEYSRINTRETTNYAFGTEYYLLPNVCIRFGTFTNYANTQTFSNTETIQLLFIENLLKNISGSRSAGTSASLVNPSNIAFLQSGGITHILELPSLNASTYRNENVNLQGYSFGISYETAKTSLSLTFISQAGGGRARLTNIIPVDLNYLENRVYFITTIKN